MWLARRGACAACEAARLRRTGWDEAVRCNGGRRNRADVPRPSLGGQNGINYNVILPRAVARQVAPTSRLSPRDLHVLTLNPQRADAHGHDHRRSHTPWRARKRTPARPSAQARTHAQTHAYTHAHTHTHSLLPYALGHDSSRRRSAQRCYC